MSRGEIEALPAAAEVLPAAVRRSYGELRIQIQRVSQLVGHAEALAEYRCEGQVLAALGGEVKLLSALYEKLASVK